MPIARPDLATAADFEQRDARRAFLLRQISALNSICFTDLLPGLGSFQIEPDIIIRHAIPTLVVTGALDPLVPPVLARGIAERITGAEFAEIANAGHSSYFEQPDEFNRVVQQFLNTWRL